MREAISKLETLGIIRRSHGVGTFILDAQGQNQRSMSLLSAGDVTALELFTVRYMIEPDGAAMAAVRRTKSDIQQLKAILKQSALPNISAKEFVELDSDFHCTVAEASKNRLFEQLYQQIVPHHQNYSQKVVSLENRMALAHQGHVRILDAIIAQDEKLARKEAYAHLKYAEKDLAIEWEKFEAKTTNRNRK
jgi:DNA-binding FadR family transcriptional regulator